MLDGSEANVGNGMAFKCPASSCFSSPYGEEKCIQMVRDGRKLCSEEARIGGEGLIAAQYNFSGNEH